MAYDAAEAIKALERPQITVERNKWWHYVFGIRQILGPTKTYTGRILSHTEWLPLQTRWLEFTTMAEPTEELSRHLIEDTCTEMGIPASEILRLPGGAMQGALNDFLACQFRANGMKIPNAQSPASSSLPVNASRNGSKRRRGRVARLSTQARR